ncbi:MAG: exodeoxyribonuclease VII small subunit [Clostridia bacterium]|jgi:exodeoxyribonuclease VII small subunit|nr:exodeoxyribonuclease VII small subunit [Clostridia bacterium]
MKEEKKLNGVEPEALSFEEAMKRLDSINEALGGENVKLEEALALYEEGVALVRICSSKLEEAERKIKILKMESTGEITEDSFEA